MIYFKSVSQSILILFCISMVLPRETRSAPCCARSAAAPFLILGDDEVQFNIGFAASNAVAEASDEGTKYFHSSLDSDFTMNYRLDGAFLISDLFQAGAGLSLVNRHVSSNGDLNSNLGVGDISLSLGYEFLPNWTYSQWKPTGFLFTVFTLPSGRSRYQNEDNSPANITGNGFYSIAIGTTFLKRWNSWDAFLVAETHYSLTRTFEEDSVPFEVSPGFGGSLGFGLGWSPGGGQFRLGVRIQPRIDQPRVRYTGQFAEATHNVMTFCDTGVDVSYMLGNTDTLMLSYVDQTFIGATFNSNLNRSLAFNFQHRWER